MPTEYLQLKGGHRSSGSGCRCRHQPFQSFLRGQVHRFRWWGLRKRYCCVICERCKQIVGYESPAPAKPEPSESAHPYR